MKEKITILIVDDDRDMLETIQEILIDSGYLVKGLTDPKKVLDVLKETEINILLSDIKMPEINGLELTKKVKAKFPDIIIILMTGFSEAYTVQDALMAGADEYITKPFKQKEIEMIVERAYWRFLSLKLRRN